MRRILFLVLALFLTQCASKSQNNSKTSGTSNFNNSSQSQNKVCNHIGQCQIDLPLYYDVPQERGTFSYKFRKFEGKANRPTIVYLAGGPGAILSDNYDSVRTSISQRSPVVLFDARGVGVNAVHKEIYGKEFYKSKYLARDVIEVLSALNIKDYILYGSSYGTMLASITADMIEKTKTIPSPRAVVVEGVLGRFIRTREEAKGSFIDLWKVVLKTLNEDTKNFLKQEFPYGESISRVEIGTFISNLLAYDIVLLKTMLEYGDAGKGIRDLVKECGTDPVANSEIFKTIACQEILDIDPPFFFNLTKDLTLEDVRFPSYCENLPVTDAFDAKKYRITSPLYYLQGELDPATPVWQAEYHRDNILAANHIYFNVVPNAAHSVLGKLSRCKEEIWDKIASNESIENVISWCIQPSQLNLTGTTLKSKIEALRQNLRAGPHW